MNKSTPSYAFSYRERSTKNKGIVYDIRFRYVDNSGHERQRSLSGFPTKKAAKQAYTEFMQNYIAPAKIGQKEPISFASAFTAYQIYTRTSVKESTQFDIAKVFRLYILPCFENCTLQDLTKQRLIAWQDDLCAEHNGKVHSYKYIMKIRGFLNTFLNWCKERYEIENYLQFIKPPKRLTPKPKMNFWEKGEFQQFIEGVDNIKWKTYFTFMFFTGCRIGESLALNENDIIDGCVEISKSVLIKTIDGTKYKITPTKVSNIRKVPLPPFLIEQLNEYIQWKKDNNISNKFLFGDDDPFAHTTVRRYFDLYTNKANLKRIRIHDLRHSYVSLLVHEGATLPVVASLIGDTLEITVNTYSHFYDTDKKSLISKISL